MHRQYLHVGSRTLAYLDSAPEGGTDRVLVLIHAFPLSGSMWEAQMKAAPAGWRVLAPDLRGFGGSTDGEVGDAGPGIDDYAIDVVDLLEELGIRQAVIGGNSMGGYVTFAVHRRAPERFRAMVLASTRSGPDSLEGRGNRRAMIALVDREGPQGVAREMMPKLLGRTTLETRPDVEPTVRRYIKQQSPAAIRQGILRMMERPDSTPQLKSIQVPALVLAGEEDAIIPAAEARQMAAALPSAELVILPGAGHLASLERPEAFSEALAAFLSRL